MGMGRPLKERGSQKTCLNNTAISSRTGFAKKILRIKRDIPGSIQFGPGIFFAPGPHYQQFLREEKA
jgi:hypothetical protein